MQIQVKLGGDLKCYGAGGPLEIDADSPVTVADAMAEVGIGADAGDVLVIVNDQIVAPGEHARFELNDGDRLALMPQLKGG